MKRPKVFSDYNLIDCSTPEGIRAIVGAITAFMRRPEDVQNRLIEAGITQFTGTSDFPKEVVQLIDSIHMGLQEIDNGWSQFFDTRDFTNVAVPGFKIRTKSSGLTFGKRPEGGRAKIYRITGEEKFIGFDTYGGGLEFDQAWVQDQQWWMIEDSIAEFTSAWYRDKAAVMYGLIGEVTSSYNVSYDSTGSTQLDKDINTLNAAAAALLTRLKNAGYPVTALTPVKVLSPIQLKGRLNRALAATAVSSAVAGANLKIEYAIDPIYSLNVLNSGSACTDKWFMGVAGLKNKLGEKMPLTAFAEFKPEAFATTTVGWGRYGGYLNEIQFSRIATA